MTTPFNQLIANVKAGFESNRRLYMLSAAIVLLLISVRAGSTALEQQALNWLQSRQTAPTDTFVLASAPSQIDKLSEPQLLLVSWLSRKYRVAPEPLSAIVLEAFELGSRKGLDPALILAVMANESRFNPLAQSPVGAQGLMQVLTRVHTDKFDNHGGIEAAFDPLVNMRVGAKILQDTIRRAGSVEGGLKYYVGAVKTDGSGYVNKVIAEQMRLHQVMSGKPTSFTALPEGMVAEVDLNERVVTAAADNE